MSGNDYLQFAYFIGNFQNQPPCRGAALSLGRRFNANGIKLSVDSA